MLLKLYYVEGQFLISANELVLSSYRSGNVFSKHGMGLVGPHVEQRLGLAEASGDIVSGLVCIAVVDFWKLFMIADQQQCRGNANNRA
jgi:hypothetical protein